MKLKTNKKYTYLFTKCTYENKITITKKKNHTQSERYTLIANHFLNLH